MDAADSSVHPAAMALPRSSSFNLFTIFARPPNERLPGELAQVLPTPEHFEQASQLVTEEMIAEIVPCGPDLDEHLQTIQEYADAGVDELHIQQIGGGHEAFFDAYEREILPKFAG